MNESLWKVLQNWVESMLLMRWHVYDKPVFGADSPQFLYNVTPDLIVMVPVGPWWGRRAST